MPIVAALAVVAASSVGAVPEVDGDPAAVARASGRRIEALTGSAEGLEARTGVRERHDGGARVLDVDQFVGGLGIQGDVVVRRGATPWMVLETCPRT